MDVASVFSGVNTSDPTVVAQAVADYMELHRDAFSPEEAAAVYEQMYSYGVPRVATPYTTPGFPSVTG